MVKDYLFIFIIIIFNMEKKIRAQLLTETV